ncbi:peptidylprolyl isomerase [Aspergillus undulatus]|uniref:peptidylprolyl isomerase n=1 Tax=Aspergillus undulatus TaxID=1810928 RepID=UPI003CCDBC6A
MGKSNAKAAASDKKGKGKEKAGDSSKSSGKGGQQQQPLKGAQEVNVRHILCEKFSKKEEALEKIRNGAKFDEVAREYSEDKARNGGSLGWMLRTKLEPAFAQVAFELEPSTTGNPKLGEAKTVHGYHIIMVEGRR